MLVDFIFQKKIVLFQLDYKLGEQRIFHTFNILLTSSGSVIMSQVACLILVIVLWNFQLAPA